MNIGTAIVAAAFLGVAAALITTGNGVWLLWLFIIGLFMTDLI